MAIVITEEMKTAVTKVTGMRLEDTEKYLIEANGDVSKAISLIRKLTDYRKQITLQMKTAVKKKTGMALEDTVPYLEAFNGDVEKALEYISSLDYYEKEITYSSKAAVMRRTGISIEEAEKYLKQSHGDIEAAVKLVEQLEDYTREITYSMKRELVNRTGIQFSDTSAFLKRTNGDIEKAVKLINALPDFDRQITRVMIETVIAQTGARESAVVEALKKTNGDIEKAVQVVNAMPVEDRVNVSAIAHNLRKKARLSSEWSSYCNKVVIESGGDLQKAYQRIYKEIIYKDKLSTIKHDTGVSESEAIYFLELSNDDEKAAVRYIKKIKQEETAVKIAREIRGVGKTPEKTEIQNNVTIGFQDFIVKTDVFKCHEKGHLIKEITAIVFCMERDGTVIEKR